MKFGITITRVYSGIKYSKASEKQQKVAELVKKIYSERAKVKATDPVMGNLYKLLPNSRYGKTLQKHHETKWSFCSQNEFTKSIYDESIKQFTEHGDQVLYEQRFYHNQIFSESHIGSLILSESKAIMNDFIIQCNAHCERNIYY